MIISNSFLLDRVVPSSVAAVTLVLGDFKSSAIKRANKGFILMMLLQKYQRHLMNRQEFPYPLCSVLCLLLYRVLKIDSQIDFCFQSYFPMFDYRCTKLKTCS